MQKIIRQRGTGPGRHHVGTPGDIISECPGDFVGIRNLVGAGEQRRGHFDAKRPGGLVASDEITKLVEGFEAAPCRAAAVRASVGLHNANLCLRG
jgi:hypothetical protein